MTKSRRALVLLAASAWPRPAYAAAHQTAEATIAAYNRSVHDMMRLESHNRRCTSGEGGDAILVCAPIGSERYRVPYDPPPGARHRLIAGEAPSARHALSAGGCLRLCEQPVSVNVIDVVHALGRGLDRLLHPD